MKRTENLRPHQEELPQLSELAGIHADPNLLKQVQNTSIMIFSTF